ncbi:MAG TPA: MlaD family protein [Bacteroidales bacterium]|nr:MlaD family protein [Bacteroidales bacterium]
MKKKKVYLVALLFIAALVLFIWGFNFLKGKDIFNSEDIYYVEYESVNGLIKSNPVVLNGLRIGQVRDINFHPDMSGRLIVQLAITSDFPIPSNSVARIYSSDLMGSKAVEIQLGSAKTLINPNDTLMSAVEASLMDEVNAQVLPLKNKAEGLISSVDSLVVIMQTLLNENAQGNIIESLQSVARTIKNLEKTTATVDNIVTAEQSRLASILYNIELITRNLEENNGQISKILSNAANLSDTLVNADVAGTVKNVNASLAELNFMLSTINSGQGSVGKIMTNDTLYYQLERSAEQLNKLLEDVRINPKRYVKFSLF